MTALPPYVIDGNLYDALAPVQLTDVVMHNLCVPADATKLQAWLDKTFSAPSGGKVRYKLLGDKVFLSFAQIGKLWNIDGDKPIKGYTSEIDVTIWILTQREDDGLFALRWIPAYLVRRFRTGAGVGSGDLGLSQTTGPLRLQPAEPRSIGRAQLQRRGFRREPIRTRQPGALGDDVRSSPDPGHRRATPHRHRDRDP